MLQPFGQGIWTSSGPEVRVFGFHYPTKMAVIRLADGDIFIWSPISLSNDVRVAIDAIGPVKHIVAPNSLHHLFLLEWQAAYPNATLYAPPKLRKKRKDIDFGGDLDANPHPAWADEIDQIIFTGNKITTEIVFFHKASRTVLFTDLLQQFPENWFSGWRKLVARLDLMVGPEPSVPRKFRAAFNDKNAARRSLARIVEWPIENVLIAHGAPVTKNAKAYIARAFSWLSS